MADVIPFQKRFFSADFLKLIRKLSKDTRNIILTDHAKERMKEKRITFPHVLACLRQGNVSEPSHKSVQGDWKCNLTRAIAGTDVTITVALDEETKLIIVTVF